MKTFLLFLLCVMALLCAVQIVRAVAVTWRLNKQVMEETINRLLSEAREKEKQ